MSHMIPAEVQAVFFDVVGTLIHPHPPAAVVYAEVGRRHGSRLDDSTIASRFRVSFEGEEQIDRAAGWRTSEEREIARWRCIVRDVIQDADDADASFEELFAHFSRPSSWRIDPDAAWVLPALCERGLVLGLASNYDHRLRTVATGLPELAPITHIAVSAELGWRKPARAFYAALCDMTGLDSERILMVGDDLMNDYEGARAAGMHAILIDPAKRYSGTNRIERLAELLDR